MTNTNYTQHIPSIVFASFLNKNTCVVDNDPYKPYPTPAIWYFPRVEGSKEQQMVKEWKWKRRIAGIGHMPYMTNM